jgi:hypothetical protein
MSSWAVISNLFVVGTLAVVGYAIFKMFGGGHHRPR